MFASVQLVFAQQSKNELCKFMCCKHECSLVLMFRNFSIFFGIAFLIFRYVPPDTVGCFAEIVAQIAVPGFRYKGVLRLKITGVTLPPGKARIFDQRIEGMERRDVANLGNDAGRPYRINPRNGIQDYKRIERHALYRFYNCLVNDLNLLLLGFDAVE